MLSDEEKQAIQYLNKYCDTDLFYEQRHYNYIKMIIRLVEKQSKEIEELKEDNKHQWEERCKLTFELENSTSNDKIKAKIEDILNSENSEAIEKLIEWQSLLEKE